MTDSTSIADLETNDDDHAVYSATTSWIGSPTRVIAKAGPANVVVDIPNYEGPDGDAPDAGQLFLAGISSCAILVFGGEAEERGLALTRAEGEIVGYVKPEFDPNGLRTFERVKLTFTLGGLSR